MSELFPESSMAKDSPRIAWLKRHNLALGELPDGIRFCAGRNWIGYGTTHLEAEEEFCAGEHIKHYSEEEFEKAIAPVPKVGIDLGEE